MAMSQTTCPHSIGKTMIQFNVDQKEAPPWTRVFIELTLQALTSTHHAYLAWNYDQTNKFSPITSGYGLALADERDVCAAITREFISSKYSHGLRFETEERHSYELRREQYLTKTGKLADIVCQRLPEKGKTYGPSIIEAKRAFRLRPDGSRPGHPTPLIGEIKDDIRKLRKLCRPRNSTLDPRGMILVWNMANEKAGTWIGPCEYLRRLNVRGDMRVWQIRHAPVACSLLKTEPLKDQPFAGVPVTSWIWVALAEVTPILANEKGASPAI